MNKSISKDIEKYLEFNPVITNGDMELNMQGMGLKLIVRLLYMIYMEIGNDS